MKSGWFDRTEAVMRHERTNEHARHQARLPTDERASTLFEGREGRHICMRACVEIDVLLFPDLWSFVWTGLGDIHMLLSRFLVPRVLGFD